MKQKLQKASSDQKKNSLLSNYEQFISKKFKKNFNQKYENIFKWSIKNSGIFWISIWDFSKIKEFKGKLKIKKSKIFYENKFLPNSKLNFAENRVIVDTLQWNGKAKKSGFETGDYISEFKVENADRPNKGIIYPIAILFLITFGYLNSRRKE